MWDETESTAARMKSGASSNPLFRPVANMYLVGGSHTEEYDDFLCMHLYIARVYLRWRWSERQQNLVAQSETQKWAYYISQSAYQHRRHESALPA